MLTRLEEFHSKISLEKSDCKVMLCARRLCPEIGINGDGCGALGWQGNH